MFQIDLVDALAPDATAALEASLREFNCEQNVAFWHARELPENAARSLYICARTDDGRAFGRLRVKRNSNG